MVITIISTVIHASTEDPSNHPSVFTIYASDDSWIAVHIGQFVGAIMVFGGGFVALYRLLVQSESKVSFIQLTNLQLDPNSYVMSRASQGAMRAQK
jgi:hypothetical protein